MTMEYFSRLLPQQDPDLARPLTESSPQLNSRDELEPIEIHEKIEVTAEAIDGVETTARPTPSPRKTAGENESAEPISPSNADTPFPTPSIDSGNDRKSEDAAPSAAEKLTAPQIRQDPSVQREHNPLPEDPPPSPLSMKAGSADSVVLHTTVLPSIAVKPFIKKVPIKLTPDTQKHAVSQPSPKQIRQAISNEVRKWVAAQTGITSEKQRAQVSKKVVAEVDRTLRGLPQNQPPMPPNETGKMVKGGFEDPAIHDLTLSIGPINITMEPAEKKSSNRVHQPRQPAKPAPEQAASRLSRHYIVR